MTDTKPVDDFAAAIEKQFDVTHRALDRLAAALARPGVPVALRARAIVALDEMASRTTVLADDLMRSTA